MSILTTNFIAGFITMFQAMSSEVLTQNTIELTYVVKLGKK
jgi:hypothetical protein